MGKSGLWVLAGLLMGCWSPAYAGTSAESPRVAAATADTTKPGVAITSPTDGSTVGASAFLGNVLRGTASDNVGVTYLAIKLSRERNGVKYYLNGNAWSTNAGYVYGSLGIYGATSITWNALPIGAGALDTGTYTLSVQSGDAAGNKSVVATRNFRVVVEAPEDTLAPGATITSPPAGMTVGASAFLTNIVRGTAGDNVGVTNILIRLSRTRGGVKYYWNGAAWSTDVGYAYGSFGIYGEKSVNWNMLAIGKEAFDTGTYDLYVQAKDAAGNIGPAASRSFRVVVEPNADTLAPGVTITSPPAGMTVGAHAFLTNIVHGTAGDNVGVTNILIKLSRTRDGVKYYWNGTAWSTDVGYAYGSFGIYGEKSVNWNMLAIGPEAFDTGTYDLYVQAKDAAGNIGPAASRSFRVVVEPNADTLAPGVTITSPPAGMTVGASAFLTNIVSGTAADNVGVTNILIRLSRTRDGVKYYWNGTGWSTNVGYAYGSFGIYAAQSVNWNMLAIGPEAFDDGTYDLYVQAKDAAGNIGPAASRSFKVVVEPNPDQYGPAVTITNPLSRQVIAADAFDADTVRGTASDNVGVKAVGVKFSRTRDGVKYYWNGGAWTTASSWAFSTMGIYGEKNVTWSMIPMGAGALDTGAYDLWVQGFDMSGNAGTPATRSFRIVASSSDVDAEKPKVTILNPPGGKEVRGDDFDSNTVNGTATDNKSILSVTVKFCRERGDVKEYWTSLGWVTTSAPAPVTITGLGTNSATWKLVAPSLSDLDAGIYTVWAQAEDYSGNLSDPATRSFSVGHILVPY